MGAAAMDPGPACLHCKIPGRSRGRSDCRRLAALSALCICALLRASCCGSALVGVRGRPLGAQRRHEARGRLLARRAVPGKSQYAGVSWHEGSGQWQSHVEDPVSGEAISLGLFGSERDAAEAFDCAALALDGEAARTNFPSDFYGRARVAQQEERLRDYFRPRPSSRFRGVYRTRGSSKWKAEIEIHGVKQFLDFFEDEVEAAQAVDDAIRSTGAEKSMQLQMLNFRRESDYFDPETWQDEAVPRGASSCFVGTTYHQRTGQFLARLGRRHLGLFDSELEAAMAFDEASAAAGGVTNFPPAATEAAA